MLESLARAMAHQYDAFQAPRPHVVDGCDCCTLPDDLAALVAAPREQLTGQALDFYASSALTTVGGVAEFRYFWPRLAELSIAGALVTDCEIVFGKPRYGESSSWPAAERDALIDLARALGQWLAAEAQAAPDVDSWVCAIGLLAEGLTDVRPLLAPLLSATDAAEINLAGFVEWNRPRLEAKRKLTNAFWESAPRSAAAVLDWYFSTIASRASSA